MNEMEANRRSNFFAASGKRVMQEQQEQMSIREDQKYKLQQYNDEQKLEIQEPVPFYLQRNDRPSKITAAERKEIIRNIEIEANRNSDGGIFAKVYKQKDAKDQQQQTQKQAFIDEIQKQIDEKKKRKEEERQKQIEEDRKYEEKLKKEREKISQNQNKEDDKKLIIKTIKNKHLRQQQDDSKFIFNEFEDHQINLTNNNIVPNYLKEVDDKYDQELKHKVNPHTPLTKLQSQRTLQDQNLINITYNPPNTAGQNQNSTSFRNNSQHQYNQPLNQYEIQQMQQQQQQQLFQQQSYQDSYQQSNYQYQPIQYRSAMPQIIQQIQQEQQELLEINKFKSREQEQGIEKLKEEIEFQSNKWNEELRRLRGEVQINTEKKNRAFYELYNLKDELKKQQLFEEANLKLVKQQIANRRPDSLASTEKKLITESDYKKSSHQSRQLSNIEDNLFLETFVDQI
ncbi:unnamed protein product [Paramecium octaurelia]|uniref:Uncharacterized protein n=1 Tax=Paramecium octaurelia TaxID=43137 RepID=A0A8S1VNZ8_PAROT|nr:unnamed protein product [Paramecium octaurelia]